jgi:hypothetical protein
VAIPPRKVYVVPAPGHERALRVHLKLFHKLDVSGSYDTVDFCLEAHEYVHWNVKSSYYSAHQHSDPPVLDTEEWDWS